MNRHKEVNPIQSVRPLRVKILNAAEDLITESGYEHVTLRRIAERVSCSPMSVYHHFAAKEEILVSLAQARFTRMAATLPKAGQDALSGLHQAILRYITFGIAHPKEYELLFLKRHGRNSTERSAKTIRHFQDESGAQGVFSQLLGYVEACLLAGVLQSDSFTTAMVLWAGVHGCISIVVTQHETFSRGLRGFAAATTMTLLRGVTIPGSCDCLVYRRET